MGKNYLQSIKSLLDNTETLLPVPPGIELRKGYDADIRCILFDIYGTLLISASGDIDQAEVKSEFLKYAFEQADIQVFHNGQSGDSEEIYDHIVKLLVEEVKNAHARDKKEGIVSPEVDILAIWRLVLTPFIVEKKIKEPALEQLRAMAFFFELLCNRLSPMPAFQSMISCLQTVGMPIGIVSNAQFYTPVVLNYFLHDTMEYSDVVEGFDPELTVFSYQKRKAKPDPDLFRELVPILRAKYKLEPHQVAFVGNDMLKDIYAANQAGFKTILFAGDERSLRLRKEKKEVQDLQADYIIDNLLQVLEISGIGMCCCNK